MAKKEWTDPFPNLPRGGLYRRAVHATAAVEPPKAEAARVALQKAESTPMGTKKAARKAAKQAKGKRK